MEKVLGEKSVSNSADSVHRWKEVCKTFILSWMESPFMGAIICFCRGPDSKYFRFLLATEGLFHIFLLVFHSSFKIQKMFLAWEPTKIGHGPFFAGSCCKLWNLRTWLITCYLISQNYNWARKYIPYSLYNLTWTSKTI